MNVKLYRRFLLLLALLSAATFVSAQPFIQKQINRRVSDYNHVGIDQSSPLSYYRVVAGTDTWVRHRRPRKFVKYLAVSSIFLLSFKELHYKIW